MRIGVKLENKQSSLSHIKLTKMNWKVRLTYILHESSERMES